MTSNDLAGKNVTLIGLGTRTHVALARYLARKGATVTVSDVKPAEALREELGLLSGLPVRLGLGGHRDEDVLGADLIFVTPGAPRDLPCLLYARDRGIPLSSEIELLFELCPAAIIGITGSNGKTTTTTLVGKICQAGGYPTLVGGNIGTPLIDRVEEIDPRSLVVLELSSFQLEFLRRSPHVGAILNITPNHLDRHGTIERYAEAKANIVAHQQPTDYAVLGIDDAQTRRLESSCRATVLAFSCRQRVTRGAWLEGDRLMLRSRDVQQEVCSRRDLRMRGDHNVSNALAAIAVATAAGIEIGAIRDVLGTFAGVEHRLEPVRRLDGVAYFNDSIATSPERAIAALRSFDERIVLIAGGRSKHLPLDQFASLIVEKARAVVLIGEMAGELELAIHGAAGGRGPVCRQADNMAAAVASARTMAKTGDVVLLSPGGTSFDMFRDFEERGRSFKAAVEGLA